MGTKQPAPHTAASATSHVRRNLFHHHLSRRPTSASTSTTATTLFESPQDDSSDIVMRDKNGNYQVELPSKPVMDDETLPEDSGREKKELDARLAEMYRNRSRQLSEPTELLAYVQVDLRGKVASLEEDNWMFEAEQEESG
ncbi:hypothetical protein LPUS_05129 [Lasallia pustulata]|uniref:Uncharacterized protein n=1 Tax=Lasallia pustulata TaxID=136370 RepID=A0A1W5CYN4_9LECA|nr:hypothetical protein LPUS_05129 [Lasallia pustulata]